MTDKITQAAKRRSRIHLSALRFCVENGLVFISLDEVNEHGFTYLLTAYGSDSYGQIWDLELSRDGANVIKGNYITSVALDSAQHVPACILASVCDLREFTKEILDTEGDTAIFFKKAGGVSDGSPF